jgi:hypothetical protein
MKRSKQEDSIAAALTDSEQRDVMLWFGWGAILEYETTPRAYLREAMKHKALFLAMTRDKRKAILRFVIEESARRQAKRTPWEI